MTVFHGARDDEGAGGGWLTDIACFLAMLLILFVLPLLFWIATP